MISKVKTRRVTAVVVALGCVGVAVAQSSATGSTQIDPQAKVTFSGLDQVRGPASAETRTAYDEVRVAPGSDTSVVDFPEEVSVTVARNPEHYYLSVERKGEVIALVDTPIDNLYRYDGTYVSRTDPAGTTAAIVVPDGVSSVTVSDASGRAADVAVENNVALVTRSGRFSARFQLAGRDVEVFPLPPGTPTK